MISGDLDRLAHAFAAAEVDPAINYDCHTRFDFATIFGPSTSATTAQPGRRRTTPSSCSNHPDYLVMHRRYLTRLLDEVDVDGLEVDDMADYAGLASCGCRHCPDRFSETSGCDCRPSMITRSGRHRPPSLSLGQLRRSAIPGVDRDAGTDHDRPPRDDQGGARRSTADDLLCRHRPDGSRRPRAQPRTDAPPRRSADAGERRARPRRRPPGSGSRPRRRSSGTWPGSGAVCRCWRCRTPSVMTAVCSAAERHLRPDRGLARRPRPRGMGPDPRLDRCPGPAPGRLSPGPPGRTRGRGRRRHADHPRRRGLRLRPATADSRRWTSRPTPRRPTIRYESCSTSTC